MKDFVIPTSAKITQADVSLVLDFTHGTPHILHWGSDLVDSAEQLAVAVVEPTAHAELDAHQFHGVWRENARGNTARPALLGHRAGKDFSQKFQLVKVETTKTSVMVISRDESAGLEVTVSFEFVGSGVLEIRQTVKNLGSTDFEVQALEVILPLPDRAHESMDFTGRWV